MTPEAEKALEDSIQVWEEKLLEDDPNKINMGSSSCPLCLMFLSGKGSCLDCPVYKKTHVSACSKTPYGSAAYSYHRWLRAYSFDGNTTTTQTMKLAWIEYAKKEIDFLKSLRESETDQERLG